MTSLPWLYGFFTTRRGATMLAGRGGGQDESLRIDNGYNDGGRGCGSCRVVIGVHSIDCLIHLHMLFIMAVNGQLAINNKLFYHIWQKERCTLLCHMGAIITGWQCINCSASGICQAHGHDNSNHVLVILCTCLVYTLPVLLSLILFDVAIVVVSRLRTL